MRRPPLPQLAVEDPSTADLAPERIHAATRAMAAAATSPRAKGALLLVKGDLRHKLEAAQGPRDMEWRTPWRQSLLANLPAGDEHLPRGAFACSPARPRYVACHCSRTATRGFRLPPKRPAYPGWPGLLHGQGDCCLRPAAWRYGPTTGGTVYEGKMLMQLQLRRGHTPGYANGPLDTRGRRPNPPAVWTRP